MLEHARLWPVFRLFFRAELGNADRIPEGSALLTGNHIGGMAPGDATFFFALGARLTDTPVYVLGSWILTRAPGLGYVLSLFGVVEANEEIATAALERGAKVLVYPGGDHDSLRPFKHRDRVFFGNRKGFLRLARKARVPIVPVATKGSHGQIVVLTQGKSLARALRMKSWIGIRSFPVVLCLPWGMLIGPFCLLPCMPLPVKIRMSVLDPLPPPGDLDAAYDEIIEALESDLRS